jgi:transcriptional regulator with XRE-family HTH domain
MAKRDKEAFADYVRGEMKRRGLKQADIMRRSGGKISDSYLSKILNGSADNPTIDALQALARGLGVPARVVILKAIGEDLEDGEDFRESLLYLLYEKLKGASPDQKRLIQQMVEMLLESVDRDRRAAV